MATDLIASSPPLPQHELEQLQNATNFGPDESSPVVSNYGPGSVTSDSVSVIGIASAALPAYMLSIQPKPCYISQESAPRVAGELYRQHKELEADGEDIGETERVQVADVATAHINSFLDKVLHDILAVSQSTQLPRLRTATADVLRRNLGKEAVAYADANLEDLLAADESEDEGEEQVSTPTDSASRWDLEQIWKRSRLRVMMRGENSDFDIDDDERHTQEAGLSGQGHRFGENAVISLHSEIFLAGVLDFLTDHAFAVAIIPALFRMRRGSKKSPTQATHQDPNVLYIEETDLEKGVLNSPLDRHWRAWRKAMRSRTSYPNSPRHGYSYSGGSSPELTRSISNQWAGIGYQNSNSDLPAPGEVDENSPALVFPEHIPLPPSRDGPGIAAYQEDGSELHVPRKSHSTMRNSLGITMADDEELAAALNGTEQGATLDNEETNIKSDPETAAALVRDAPTIELQHPERSSSLSNPVASPSPTAKRNREAAVGMGFPNGISLPGDVVSSGDATVLPAMDEDSTVATQENTASVEDPRLRAASPSSEGEGSDLAVMSPRDFMASRNLPRTRALHSDTQANPPPAVSPLAGPPPVMRPMKLQTSGLMVNRNYDHSPVSPLTAAEIGLGGLDRGPDSSRYGVVTSVSSGPDRYEKPDNKRTESRKTSAPTPRLVDDLARARGSPKMRQTSLQDRESLRRIAVERNGSLVSLVEDSVQKVRKNTLNSPLTSSSIVSAEDFDSLLNGSETIKLTLSPSTVRETPVRIPWMVDRAYADPRQSEPPSRTTSMDQSSLARHNGSRDDLSNVLKKKNPDMGGRSPSLKSPSVGSSDKSARGRSGSSATEKTGRSTSRPSVRNKSRTRAGFVAREAAVQTSSISDFADFIRSTGPDREPQTLIPALQNAAAQRQASVSAMEGRAPSISGASTVSPTRQSSLASPTRGASVSGPPRQASVSGPIRQSSVSGPQMSESTGIKYKRNYVAREARGSQSTSNAGLIDFIRTGPNPAKDNMPSKDIAPFRYSMDSDEMREAVINLDEPTGHRASVSTMNTMQTMMTYNSHAPLVPGGRQPSISMSTSPRGGSTPRLQAAPAAKPQKQSSYTTDAEGVRRYRNKDPYAIDISDDEYEDDGVDLFATTTAQQQPPRKSIAGSSINHSSRSGSLGPFMSDSNTAYTTDASTDPRSLSSSSRGPLSAGLSNPTPSSPPLPAPAAPPAAASSPAAPSHHQPGRVVIPRNPNRPKLEVRGAATGARGDSGSTRDLADFFKNSGPIEGPPSMNSSAAPSPNIGGTGGKEKGEGKGKFWQRKRYLDMP